MGRPRFDIPDPVGTESAESGAVPPGGGSFANGSGDSSGSKPAGKRPRFDIPDPVEDAPASAPEASWEDIAIAYAQGVSPLHARLGERLGDWAADKMGKGAPEGAETVGKGVINSVPVTGSTRLARGAGMLTTAPALAYLGGPTLAGQAGIGALHAATTMEGGLADRAKGAAIGGLLSGAGGLLAKGATSAMGAVGKALGPAAVPRAPVAPPPLPKNPSWFEPTRQTAEDVWETVGPEVLEVAAPEAAKSGLGSTLARGLGGAVSGGLLTGAAGGDWKTGAALGAFGAGGGKTIGNALLPYAPAAASAAGKVAGGAFRGLGQAAAHVATTPSNDAAMDWSVQSLLHKGNTGLPPEDEARLTEAVSSGDADKVKAENYQLQMKHPEYAAKVRGELKSVQRTED